MRADQNKHWQANYDYARAMLKARLAFMNEYNKLLGDVLTETLPTLEAKQDSYRLASSEKMKSKKEIVKLAEKQAQDIVDDARRQARETRLEMEDWADGILSTLEVNLDKFLAAVKRGRERLHERSQETVVAGIGPEPRDLDDDSYL